LKRNFGRLTTGAARHRIHLARPAADRTTVTAATASAAAWRAASSAAALRLARGTTIGATVRLILKTLGCEEFLFACAEREFGTAVGAGQSLVGIQSETPRNTWELVSTRSV
jgi:hypothetical protein